MFCTTYSTISTASSPELTVNEETKALLSVDTKKSAGPDCIPGRLLKLAAHTLGEPLCYPFDMCSFLLIFFSTKDIV